MKRLIFALLFTLLVVPANACDVELCQVPVSTGIRVHNCTKIQCVWSCLETCANYQGINEAKNLTDEYKFPSNPNDATEVLSKRGVKWEQVTQKSNLEIQALWIQEKVAKGYPVPVGIKPAPNILHMITVVHYKDSIVRYIDPDDEMRIKEITEKDFLKIWQGWAIVIMERDK